VNLLADNRDQTLASAGFGVRAAWSVASLELAWGRGLRAPDTIPEENRLHASFNFQF
jgi:hemolysin activation/secretion protein